MRRNNNRNKRHGRRNNGGSSTMGGPFGVRMQNAGRISFTSAFFTTAVLAAGANVLSLNPNAGGLGPLLTSLSSLFSEYRVKSLEIVCHPSSSDYAVCYIPETLTTPPSTIANVSTHTNSILVRSNETVPRSLYVNRTTLLGDASAKWWKTIPTAGADDWDEIQGLIDIVGTTSMSYALELKFHIQFTSAGTGQGSGLARRSVVRDRSLPIIDMYLPDVDKWGFPPDLNVDDEMKRVHDAYQKHAPKGPREAKRLALL